MVICKRILKTHYRFCPPCLYLEAIIATSFAHMLNTPSILRHLYALDCFTSIRDSLTAGEGLGLAHCIYECVTLIHPICTAFIYSQEVFCELFTFPDYYRRTNFWTFAKNLLHLPPKLYIG